MNLACIGCFRLPSDMDDERDKHPICDMCRDEKLPTTYLCGVNCPANPGAWELHGVFHKKLRKQRKKLDDGGVTQQWDREFAERVARRAAQAGDEYSKLMAEGARYESKEDWRRAGKAYREAIALRPDKSAAYFSLGTALTSSGHDVEAAQRTLEAKERLSVGSELWALTTACAFSMLLRQEECAEAAKPEWWNDEGLKALSARVVRAAPNQVIALNMRAQVLTGLGNAWLAGPRSAAELKEAAVYYDRSAAMSDGPASKTHNAHLADWCRRQAERTANRAQTETLLMAAKSKLEALEPAEVQQARADVQQARADQARDQAVADQAVADQAVAKVAQLEAKISSLRAQLDSRPLGERA